MARARSKAPQGEGAAAAQGGGGSSAAAELSGSGSVSAAAAWRHWAQAYYLANALLCVAYVAARAQLGLPDDSALRAPSFFGATRELELVVTLVLFLVTRWRRAATTEAFASQAILYCKIAVLGQAFLVDLRLFAWLAILAAALALSVPAPQFGWGGVEALTLAELGALKDRAARPALVLFFAPWNQSCIDMGPTFVKLAARYGGPGLRFARVDLSRWPEAAEEYGVDTVMGSSQLPSLLLFEAGACTRRLPRGTSVKEDVLLVMDEPSIVNYFSLQQR
jgi:thiol-disulfide isomerase/thioredoxin